MVNFVLKDAITLGLKYRQKNIILNEKKKTAKEIWKVLFPQETKHWNIQKWLKWNECIMQEIIFFTRNFLSKTWSRRKHEYKSVLYLIMNKTISVQSFLIRSKFVFQKIDVKSCFVVNSVYTNNILNLMYKPFVSGKSWPFFLQT